MLGWRVGLGCDISSSEQFVTWQGKGAMIKEEEFHALGLYEPAVDEIIKRMKAYISAGEGQKIDSANKLLKFVDSCTGAMEDEKRSRIRGIVQEAMQTGGVQERPLEQWEIVRGTYFCMKCEGSGKIYEFRRHNKGMCYECQGRGYVKKLGQPV